MSTNGKTWQGEAFAATAVLSDPREADVLSDPEATEYLRLRPGTLARWRLERRGPAWSRLGRRVCYRRSDLLAFVTANRVEPVTP